ncbi:unnamed protein product [Rotaria sp. Silwood2]|nr:unnamed protein product [Rotaria sp. Silwood2]CAF2484931.1 unnamed protein product [Rotaria sp. Silwood2]CAF2868479.1 unnamed protein product [Rotaria sp. Silwood2]CAF4174224.1 unnamed protein product [Rotaria sp. Silwood2]CAF4207376.1 unnamed protein product [Rotaria sp. Silwood2]
MAATFIIIIIVVIIILRYITYFAWNKNKRSNIILTGDAAHNILKSSDYTRHKSNEWLIDTLSIVNPFTINDESLLKAFKNKVITTLAHWSNEKNYENLVSTIENRIKYRLSLLQLNNSKFYLSKLVKQVTLDSFLSSILNVNATEELLTELPELIIYLWKNRYDKKAQDRLQKLLLANKNKFSQSDIWQQIQTILSNHSNIISKIVINDFDEKISNPLNIIIPGWETMWRLVFYSLLELLRQPKLLCELRLQLNNYSKSYRDCLLLTWILKETLRLYPPTKNIYRTNLKTGQHVCINVLLIHRDKNVWGSDVLDFNPYRFKEKLTAEQEKSYLPFSISCPARFNFAYTFAGAIVAKILEYCPTFSITEEAAPLPNDQLLDLARDSYNDLVAIK